MTKIRSIVRAFKVLRAMNGNREFSLRELQAATELPKPTVFRILSTLHAEGYVIALRSSRAYRLSSRVRELGDGLSKQAQVADVGAPIALETTRRIVAAGNRNTRWH